MTLEELGACLKQLINDCDRLTLPGFGFLYCQETASQLIKNGSALTPPSRKIFFTAELDSNVSKSVSNAAESSSNSSKSVSNAAESSSSTVSANYSSSELNPIALLFSKENEIDYNQAYSELENLCCIASDTLEMQAYINIPDFGTIRYGAGLDFVFETHPNLEFNLNNWGLDIICAKKMQVNPPVKEEGEAEKGTEEEEKEDVKQEVNEEIKKEIGEEAEDETGKVTGKGAEEGAEEGTEEEVKIETEKEEENERLGEQEKQEKQEKPEKKEEQEKHNKRRAIKIIVLIMVLAILLFVAAMFIFKDSFMPLWEKLLYTEEELQYLKNVR